MNGFTFFLEGGDVVPRPNMNTDKLHICMHVCICVCLNHDLSCIHLSLSLLFSFMLFGYFLC